MNASMPNVDKAVPVFFVQDAKRSIAWYTHVLSFRVLFDYGEYAGIGLDGAHIHLAQRSAPHGVRLKGGCYLRLASGIDERQPRGLGLGLFIAHRIVLAHGGTIEVASTSSEGTRFTVCLPRGGAAKQRQLP